MEFYGYALVITYDYNKFDELCFDYNPNKKKQYAIYSEIKDASRKLDELNERYPDMEYKIIKCKIREV